MFLKEENIPEGIPKDRCEIFDTVKWSKKHVDGVIFYSTANEQQLCNGAGAIGLTEPSEKVKSGEMHYSLGKFSSLGSAKRTVDAIPRVNTYNEGRLAYSPLELSPYNPDIVIIICNPTTSHANSPKL